MMLVPKNLNEPFYDMAQVRSAERDHSDAVAAARSPHVSQARRLIGHALIRAGRLIAAETRLAAPG